MVKNKKCNTASTKKSTKLKRTPPRRIKKNSRRNKRSKNIATLRKVGLYN